MSPKNDIMYLTYPTGYHENPADSVEPKSMLRTAIAVLSEQHQPTHINDLVNLVSKRRGKLTPRTSLESVLAIAAKKGAFGLKRTAPGTFEVEKR